MRICAETYPWTKCVSSQSFALALCPAPPSLRDFLTVNSSRHRALRLLQDRRNTFFKFAQPPKLWLDFYQIKTQELLSPSTLASSFIE
jgi:hypothetical protein